MKRKYGILIAIATFAGILLLLFTVFSLRLLARTTTASPSSSSSGGAPVAQQPTQSNTEGQVTVAVTPLNLDKPSTPLQFQVALDTHSVPLNYDLAQLATLRTDRGSSVAAASWDGGRGGHHLRGTLSFPAVDLKGASWVEVEVRGVAGVPDRVFRWSLSQQGSN